MRPARVGSLPATPDKIISELEEELKSESRQSVSSLKTVIPGRINRENDVRVFLRDAAAKGDIFIFLFFSFPLLPFLLLTPDSCFNFHFSSFVKFL